MQSSDNKGQNPPYVLLQNGFKGTSYHTWVIFASKHLFAPCVSTQFPAVGRIFLNSPGQINSPGWRLEEHRPRIYTHILFTKQKF
jgi:hypothetical protein